MDKVVLQKPLKTVATGAKSHKMFSINVLRTLLRITRSWDNVS